MSNLRLGTNIMFLTKNECPLSMYFFTQFIIYVLTKLEVINPPFKHESNKKSGESKNWDFDNSKLLIPNSNSIIILEGF